MIRLYALKIPEIIDDMLFENWIPLVSLERQTKIKKYIYKKDQIQSLFSEILLRYILESVLKITNGKIEFSYNYYGKPRLKDEYNIEFNLSHSEDWVLCGINDSSVGVDVEKMKDINFDVAKRFFTSKEYEDLLLSSEEEAKEKFYLYWTLKESFIKNVGRGLNIPLNTFEFILDNENINLYINKQENYDYHFKRIYLEPKVVASVCWQGEEVRDRISVQIIDVKDIVCYKFLDLSCSNYK